MVHDENPSDVWWHDTDTLVSYMHDKVFFGKYKKSDYDEVTERVSDLHAKYSEAKILCDYRRTTGIITTEELANVQLWAREGHEMIAGIRAMFTRIHVADRYEIDSNEIELLGEKLHSMLVDMREHIRDHYILERELESREVLKP
jgi:hypothetical protein